MVNSNTDSVVKGSERIATAIGFWLPMGRSEFFHSKEDHDLLQHSNKLDSQPDFSIGNLGVTNSTESSLGVSVYRRLVTIAIKHDYQFAIPYFPEFRLDYLQIVEDTDPEAIVLISNPFPLQDDPNQQNNIQETGDYRSAVKRIVLVVSYDGYYRWFFYHEPREDYQEFVSYLKTHLHSMIGSLTIFKSDPELMYDGSANGSIDKHFGWAALDKYAEDGGLLLHFQLNHIFEGINNSLLDPRLWFSTGQPGNHSTQETGHVNIYERNIELEKSRYSLAGFMGELVTYTDCVSTETEAKWLRDAFRSLRRMDEPKAIPDIRNHMRGLVFEDSVNRIVRRDCLRQYLRKTLLNLQDLRINLADDRRGLLPHIISFKHYQQQFVQLSFNDPRSLEFYGVNQSQLAGYIKLVTNKLPLIQEIRREIELNFAKLSKVERNSIQGFFQDWLSRAEALSTSTTSLEIALDRLNDEQMQHDQAQIRREQETQAEMARRQQRLGLSSHLHGEEPVPSFLNLWLIFIGGVSAIFTITYGISQPLTVQSWALAVLLPAAILLVIFVVLKYIGNWLAARYQNNHKFFHELDLSLELPMSSDGASVMFEKGFRDRLTTIPKEDLVIPAGLVTSARDGLISLKDSHHGRQVEYYLKQNLPHFPTFKGIEQVAYRYSQGTHKVHYEFDLHWPSQDDNRLLRLVKKLLWKLPYFSNPDLMENCEIVYEVLSHSPSSKVEHMLQEFSFVATYKKKLSPQQVMYLKLKLVNNFILRWLPKQYKPMEAEILEHLLPLFSLTVAVLSDRSDL